MIQELSGDILLTRAEALAHGVAPGDPFDGTLTAPLRERWPDMYREFRRFTNTTAPQPGSVWAWDGPAPDLGPYVRTIAMFVQDSHDLARATLQSVTHALVALRAVVVDEALHSLALPRIGTGAGGGLAWDDVRPLIHKYLGGLDIPVYLYVEHIPGIYAPEKV
jgi:O-acetyl-ADP-ribose deacetylase (regulator of RNase III)